VRALVSKLRQNVGLQTGMTSGCDVTNVQ